MTLRIPKSQLATLGYDFAAAVVEHKAALDAHRFSGDARPRALQLVEDAIRREQYPVEEGKPDDFVIDYEIVDDTPPPPTLAERKAKARADLLKEEQVAIDALIAPEKVRLAQMQYQRALAVVEAVRSDADKKLIEDWEVLMKRVDDIRFAYAQREASIADMT